VTNDSKRSVAEWVSLGISLGILLILLGLVFYTYLRNGDQPPIIDIQPQIIELRNESGGYYLPIDVTNTGSQTAQEITVQITLSVENASIESMSFSLPFLGGGESARGVVVFQQDPTTGELSTGASFLEP
jgi:uncharacterized protein (TIGR02588 family)